MREGMVSVAARLTPFLDHPTTHRSLEQLLDSSGAGTRVDSANDQAFAATSSIAGGIRWTAYGWECCFELCDRDTIDTRFQLVVTS